MDATLGSVESDVTDELVRLRERAYGPDADIAQDAAAQARLSELESARRRSLAAPVTEPITVRESAIVHERTSRPKPEWVPDADSVPGRDPVPDRDAVPALVEGSTSTPAPAPNAEPVEAAIAAPGTPWWHRRRSWAIIGTGALAVALVASAIAWMSPRPPDHVLALQSVGEKEDFVDVYGNLEWLGLDSEGLRRYEDFRGFAVWSGMSRYGTECLLVSRPDEGLGAGGCAPEGLPTIADLQKYTGVIDEVFGDMPTGSLIRFVLNGDRVDVFLGEADPIQSLG